MALGDSQRLQDDIATLLYSDQSIKYYSKDAGDVPLDLKTLNVCIRMAERITNLVQEELIQDEGGGVAQ